MSKGKRIKTVLSTTALAGVSAMLPVQAQGPEFEIPQVPQVKNEFGAVGNSDAKVITFEKVAVDENTNFTVDEALLDLSSVDGSLRSDYFKYYFDGAENSIKVKNYSYDDSDRENTLVAPSMEVTQDFIDNHSEGGSSGIYIEVIKPGYHGSNAYAYSDQGFVEFYNPDGYIEEISADFVNSHYNGGSAGFEPYSKMGRAFINNSGHVGTIDATFVATYGMNGGSGGGTFIPLISNYGIVDTLKADFIANSGSAVRNEGYIETLDVNLIANGANNYSEPARYGDVTDYWSQIENYNAIKNIKGSFIDNASSTEYNSIYGGTIYNEGIIGEEYVPDMSMVQNLDLYHYQFTNSDTGEVLSVYLVAPEGGNPAPLLMLQEALAEGMKIGTVNKIENSHIVAADEFEVLKQNIQSDIDQEVVQPQQ
jgi:hypothetical protein